MAYTFAQYKSVVRHLRAALDTGEHRGWAGVGHLQYSGGALYSGYNRMAYIIGDELFVDDHFDRAAALHRKAYAAVMGDYKSPHYEEYLPTFEDITT